MVQVMSLLLTFHACSCSQIPLRPPPSHPVLCLVSACCHMQCLRAKHSNHPVLMCVCVRACVRACVRVCVCESREYGSEKIRVERVTDSVVWHGIIEGVSTVAIIYALSQVETIWQH